MKTTHSHSLFSPFIQASFSRQAAAARRAFSLVEVTLALGIVTFAMVGVVGVLPTALSSGRQSFDQNRAATIANTLFTSFRSQTFSNVGYLDEHFDENGVRKVGNNDGLDLNQLTTAKNDDKVLYAWFTETSADAGGDIFGEQRHLCFGRNKPQGGTRYAITLHFNNHPDGMMVTPSYNAGSPASSIPAQANQIEVTISPLAQPADKYRFVSTIANRF